MPSDSVIGPEMCPACGRMAWLVRTLTGLLYCHSAFTGGGCFGEVMIRPDDAESIRLIRERGGERLRLAAHP